MKKDSIPYIVAFTLAACVLYVLPLAVANELTKPRVELNKRFAVHSAVLRAFGVAYADPSDAEAKYSTLVKESPEEGTTVYRAEIDGVPYIGIRRAGPGLWGSITSVVVTDRAATRIRGLEILDQVETPGLGGRIDEAWFKEQFRGERIGSAGTVSVDQSGTGKGDPDKENGRVDAVSGASRTSDFIQAIVNGAIADLKRIGGAK